LEQLAGDVSDSGHGFDHVDRDPNRPALVRDSPCDGLADPPGCVGTELEAATVFEFIDRPHQSRVSFLDQVQEAQAAVAILFGDRDDQSQVSFAELLLCVLVLGENLFDHHDAVAQ